MCLARSETNGAQGNHPPSPTPNQPPGSKRPNVQQTEVSTEDSGRSKSKKFKELLKTFITACGDQQLFISAAYIFAFFLPFGGSGFMPGDVSEIFSNDCSLSSYHGDIICNLLLMGCATHLLCVTVIRHFWWNPLFGFIRVIFTILIVYLTGLELSARAMPCSVSGTPTYSCNPFDLGPLELLPSPCVAQIKNGTVGTNTWLELAFSSLNPHSPGGNITQTLRLYAIITLWYFFVCIAEIYTGIRILGSRITRHGRRPSRLQRLHTWLENPVRRRLLYGASATLTLGSIILSLVTIGATLSFIISSRSWLNNSEWVERSYGQTAEHNSASLGQILAILSFVTTIWSLGASGLERTPKHLELN